MGLAHLYRLRRGARRAVRVPPLTRFPLTAFSGCGGMADAADSKSAVGNYMWVQVPPSAVSSTDLVIETTYCASSFFQHQYL